MSKLVEVWGKSCYNAVRKIIRKGIVHHEENDAGI